MNAGMCRALGQQYQQQTLKFSVSKDSPKVTEPTRMGRQAANPRTADLRASQDPSPKVASWRQDQDRGLQLGAGLLG